MSKNSLSNPRGLFEALRTNTSHKISLKILSCFIPKIKLIESIFHTKNKINLLASATVYNQTHRWSITTSYYNLLCYYTQSNVIPPVPYLFLKHTIIYALSITFLCPATDQLFHVLLLLLLLFPTIAPYYESKPNHVELLFNPSGNRTAICLNLCIFRKPVEMPNDCLTIFILFFRSLCLLSCLFCLVLIFNVYITWLYRFHFIIKFGLL